MKKPKDVDAYIAAAPEHVRAKLRQLRAAIRQAAPKAIERMSYGMPCYAYNGRGVYFAHAKAHVGLYVPPPIIDEHKAELKGYSTTKATVRLPLDQKLPITLIKKLVKARMKRNEE